MLLFFTILKTLNLTGQPAYLNNCFLEALLCILQKYVDNSVKTKPLWPCLDFFNPLQTFSGDNKLIGFFAPKKTFALSAGTILDFLPGSTNPGPTYAAFLVSKYFKNNL